MKGLKPMQGKNCVTAKLLPKGLLGATLTALVLFALAGNVWAKGPVSLTISGPGIDEPLELVAGADRALLTRLMEQTGLWYATGDLPRPLAGPPAELGPRYTLTWVNGGPPDKSREERTIRQELYLVDGGGLVIHTPDQETLENWGQGVIGWFAAPDGLRDTLAEMGAPLPAATSSAEGGAAETAPGVPWQAAVAGLALVVAFAGALGARRAASRRPGWLPFG
jgi:hypothetical protein